MSQPGDSKPTLSEYTFDWTVNNLIVCLSKAGPHELLDSYITREEFQDWQKAWFSSRLHVADTHLKRLLKIIPEASTIHYDDYTIETGDTPLPWICLAERGAHPEASYRYLLIHIKRGEEPWVSFSFTRQHLFDFHWDYLYGMSRIKAHVTGLFVHRIPNNFTMQACRGLVLLEALRKRERILVDIPRKRIIFLSTLRWVEDPFVIPREDDYLVLPKYLTTQLPCELFIINKVGLVPLDVQRFAQ